MSRKTHLLKSAKFGHNKFIRSSVQDLRRGQLAISARADSACVSQKSISMERYSSIAAASSGRAASLSAVHPPGQWELQIGP